MSYISNLSGAEECLYEVVDSPANDGVVEHAHIDVDHTDGVPYPLQHRTDLLPERQTPASEI